LPKRRQTPFPVVELVFSAEIDDTPVNARRREIGHRAFFFLR